MRYASMFALTALTLSLGVSALADIGDEGETEAAKNAAALTGADTGIDDDPQGPLCATTGGHGMSLLGVQYQGGPDVHGMVTALADSHPLRVALTKKENAIKKLDEQQSADMKAFPGGGNGSWDATVDDLNDSVNWYSKQVAGREENIRKLKQNKEDILHDNPGTSVEGIEKAIGDNEMELGKAQAHLGDAQARLPQAQAGKARYDAAMRQAQLAKDSAENAAKAAAAACP